MTAGDGGDKGFRVVDRRSEGGGRQETEREPAGAAPPDAGSGCVPGDAFLDLVHSLQFGAMMHLGLVADPEGKPAPPDLPAARHAIDLLGVLREKTKGNLTAEEDAALSDGLYSLRMAWLSVFEAGRTNSGGGKA